MNTPRIYFRVTSGPCHNALIAWRTKRQEIAALHWDLGQLYGAVGLYPGSDDNVGNARAINALIFKGELPEGWKRASAKAFHRHDAGQVAGKPDLRTSIGKAAEKAIKALPLTPHVDRVTREIGFPMSLDYLSGEGGGSSWLGWIDCMAAGWIKDTFYVSLPDIDHARREHMELGRTVTTPDWRPLPGMEQILKEEMELEYARDRARKADQALA
ncbi:MAG TPA: hypothetical protein VEZ59_02730 [Sphingopyxis sp.]|nr:hypothetical protein [Sphingopyxis sp.]